MAKHPPKPSIEEPSSSGRTPGFDPVNEGSSPSGSTEPSREQDEHRGLAAKIVDLRKTVEEQRQLTLRELGELRQRTAQAVQGLDALTKSTDAAVEKIQQMQRDLEAALREGGEQVRKAGEIARKMSDQVQALEELRETASDPHEVIKPLQRGLALLKGDVEQIEKRVDLRFEQLPRAKAKAWEERSPEEDPIVKMGAEVRKLRQRLQVLEDEKARA